MKFLLNSRKKKTKTQTKPFNQVLFLQKTLLIFQKKRSSETQFGQPNKKGRQNF